MSDRYIEKSFLFLLLLSLLLHVGVGALLYYLPSKAPQSPKEPVFIDLQQVPELTPQQPTQQDVKRFSDQRTRVERETAPSGKDILTTSPKPSMPLRPQAQTQYRDTAKTKPEPPVVKNPVLPMPKERRDNTIEPGSSVASLLKPRNGSRPALGANLTVGAKQLANMEDTLLRQYQKELEQDDVVRINADDVNYGSLYRRMHEQLIENYTNRDISSKDGTYLSNKIGLNNTAAAFVVITLNKKGDVIYDKTYILKSSGINLLDDIIMDSIKKMGPLGRLPKQHVGDELKIPWLFTYSVVGRMVR